MRVIDGIIGFLIIVGIIVALFFKQFQESVKNMFVLWAVLLIPLFFIILAFMFFTGGKFEVFANLYKPVFAAIIIIALIWGFSSTLGNDVSQQLTGNAVKPTDAIFTQEVLNLVVFLVIGITVFSIVLIKSG